MDCRLERASEEAGVCTSHWGCDVEVGEREGDEVMGARAYALLELTRLGHIPKTTQIFSARNTLLSVVILIVYDTIYKSDDRILSFIS